MFNSKETIDEVSLDCDLDEVQVESSTNTSDFIYFDIEYISLLFCE